MFSDCPRIANAGIAIINMIIRNAYILMAFSLIILDHSADWTIPFFTGKLCLPNLRPNPPFDADICYYSILTSNPVYWDFKLFKPLDMKYSYLYIGMIIYVN